MEEFLMLIPGSIGSVQYKWQHENAVPQKQKDAYIDGCTAEAMHALVQKAMYVVIFQIFTSSPQILL